MKILDAQAAMGFLVRQTSYIEQAVNEVVYADIQYPNLVPVDTSAPEWVKTVTYYSADKFGAAKWLNGGADDVPKAGTQRTKFETSVYTAGIGYGYTLEEISQAALLNVNLANDNAMAARRSFEEMVEKVALYGDTEKGFEGLLNASTVPQGAAATGNWATATGVQIQADVNGALLGQFTNTNFVSIADTLLLPYAKFLQIATKPLSDTYPEMTVLAWLQTNNVYTAQTGQPLTIRAVRGLETLGSGGTNRMVAYRKDPQVVKLHMPMPHKFLPVWQSGPTQFDVPGIFRLGGVDWRRPKEANYVDGI